MNFDHPDAFDLDLLVAHLSDLIAGRPIRKPTYDFTTHTRAPATVEVLPRRVVVVDGLLLLAEVRLRELFDLKVFVDVGDDIRFIRRLGRDVTERGRSVDDVVQQYLATVRPMHRQYVEPSKRYADLILSEGGKNRAGVDLIVARIERELGRWAGRARGVSAVR
jgi:uridine kinase